MPQPKPLLAKNLPRAGSSLKDAITIDHDDFDDYDDFDDFQEEEMFVASGSQKQPTKSTEVKANPSLCCRPITSWLSSSQKDKGPTKGPLGEVNEGSVENELWIDKYKPTSVQDLAVHAKKVADVRNTIEQSFQYFKNQRGHTNGRKGPKIILLTGPAGCGKTAVMNVLSKNMNFDICEWVSPVQEERNFANAKFSNELEEKKKEWTTSALQKFEKFLFRCEKYSSLMDLSEKPRNVFDKNTSRRKRVILAEDLPYFKDSFASRDKLRAIIEDYLRKGNCPLVFIISDFTHTSDGYSTLNRIFSPANLASIFSESVATVRFNPIAKTILVKALSKIMANELECRPRRTLPLSKGNIERVADLCGGDIRNAINILQFDSLTLPLEGHGSSTVGIPKSTKRKRNANPLEYVSERKGGDISFGRDAGFLLFRALGKVLYCKREECPPAKMEGFKLPDSLKEYHRSPTITKTEEILDKVTLTPSTFQLFLHENYLDFFSSGSDDDLDRVARIAEYLSDAEMMNSDYRTHGFADEYAGHLVCRSLMLFRSIDSAGSHHVYKSLRKPEYFAVVADSKTALESVKCLKMEDNSLTFADNSLSILCELTLPFAYIINRLKCHSSPLSLYLSSIVPLSSFRGRQKAVNDVLSSKTGAPPDIPDLSISRALLTNNMIPPSLNSEGTHELEDDPIEE
eukprot:Nk52_evm11s218 gene=Nk52_evmTU11s218